MKSKNVVAIFKLTKSSLNLQLKYKLDFFFKVCYPNKDFDSLDEYKKILCGGLMAIEYTWVMNGFKETTLEISDKITDLINKLVR